MRHCPDCAQDKDESDFYRIGSDRRYFSSYCKPCVIRRSATSAASESLSDRRARQGRYSAKVRGSAWGRAKLIVGGMRQRSRRKGLGVVEFDREEVASIIDGGSCARTGIAFEFGEADGHSGPWTPTPDRIDSKLGYTKANVQWVCAMYNAMKNEWGEADVDRMVEALIHARQNAQEGLAA